MTSRPVRLSDCSVMYPSFPFDPVEFETYAKFVQLTEMRRLYVGQTMIFEPHTTLARLAGGGSTTPLGTAVTLMPLRNPMIAALHAREIAMLTGTTYVAGLGLGSKQMNEAMCGGWPSSPIGYVREYATIVRDLLDGETVNLQGEFFNFRGRLEPQLEFDADLALGVLRPRMTELAGQVADRAISWLTPPEYCGEQLVPALERGGVDRDQRTRLATVVNVGVERPGRNPVDLVLAGLGNHLAAPHYGDALTKAGYDIKLGDRDHNAEEVVNRGLYIYGSPTEIVDQLGAYLDAGVEEILLNVGGVYLSRGSVEALQDLEEITSAMEGSA